jgi:hypothetical protein
MGVPRMLAGCARAGLDRGQRNGARNDMAPTE